MNLGGCMSLVEIVVLSIGLAMDAFAASICKGLCMKKMQWKKAAIIGTYFGVFQALMPVIGYLLGINFETHINQYDHWIVFILLGFLGVKMIKSALNEECNNNNELVDMKNMLLLSFATSVDALAVRNFNGIFEG